MTTRKSRRSKRGYPKRQPYNIPDKYDKLLHEEDLEKLGKKLDEEGKPVPITQKQLISLCAGKVRQVWMKRYNKLHFLTSKMEWNTNPNERGLKHWQCNSCKQYFKSDEINVDHIHQPVRDVTSSWEVFEQWSSNILDAGGDEDLQILCIECHDVKSHMENNGLTSTQEAIADKQAIVINKTAKDSRQWLEKNGIVPASTALKRRVQIRDKLLEGMNDEHTSN